MSINIRPLYDRVVVRRLEEDTTSGGIVIPDSAKDKPSRGEVIAVGPGKRGNNGNYCDIGVKVGEKILFGKYAGTEVEVAGSDYVVMREDDIMAVVE